MAKFRKKPVVIDAWQLGSNEPSPDWLKDAILDERVMMVSLTSYPPKLAADIRTLEGTMRAQEGDWIIKGVQGELYPCKPDIFEATYELAE